MAISRVSAQDNRGTAAAATVTVTYASTPTQGNTIIACAYSNVTTGLTNVGSGWTNIVEGAFSGTAQSLSIWAKIAGVSETTGIVATATGATVICLSIYEYSGLAAALTTDGTPTSSTSGVTNVATLASGNVTTTNANDLIFAHFATGGTSTAASFTNSFVLLQETVRNFAGELIVAATGTYNTTASWTTSLRAGSVIAAFQGAAAGTTVIAPSFSLLGVGV